MALSVIQAAGFYEYFYRKYYKSQHQFQLEQYQEQIDDFIDFWSLTMSLNIGFKWMWGYLIHQFTYWDFVKPKTPNGKIIPKLIFGQAAIRRFNTRNQKFDYQFEKDPFIAKHNLSYEELLSEYGFQSIRMNKDLVEFNRDPIKRYALNTIEGFRTCIERTTLYNDKDSACQQCSYAQECKVILHDNYKTLFDQRGYSL